ncbi:MAG: hypothetical protein U1F67_02680 [Rubrivivax sp.]
MVRGDAGGVPRLPALFLRRAALPALRRRRFGNVQPVWFYAAVLLLFCLPWLPWLWRARAGDRAGGGTASLAASSFIRVLPWTWAAAVVVFFSLPQSKLVGYVLPALPPLALLAAIGYAGATAATAPTPATRRLWAAGLVACAAVGLGTVAWLGVHPQKSTRPLALALLAQHGPGEPVFMLGRYDYDVPVYAALRNPVFVVDDWAAPALRRADDWHREPLDAAGFAPGPAARRRAVARSVPAAVCATGTAWVIGTAAQSGLPVSRRGVARRHERRRQAVEGGCVGAGGSLGVRRNAQWRLAA